MKISTIIPEGTLVKAGDVVAELDRGPAATEVSEVQLALQKAEAQYTQAQLDSTLNLSKAREELRTLEYALEERRIGKEQAAFEAPSIRRQAEIDYEKAERALAQAKVDYRTKTQQAVAKMSEVGADMERQRNRLRIVEEVMAGHTVRAPASGMVIYAREWNGKKKGAGSQISPWEPTVATLPDLTDMESVTYVNEIDVRRLAVGQPVAIALDADPDKRLTGRVVSVANVGEQRPNQTATDFGAAYESPLTRQRLTIGVEMPIMQWGAGRAAVAAARADRERVESAATATRLEIEENARFAALGLTQAQRVLVISAKADTVATRRFDVAKNRYVIGKIGIGELYIAQSEKDGALREYVQALRGYWAAYYRLRRLTLYDFAADRPVEAADEP